MIVRNIEQCLQPDILELADPAADDLGEWNRIQIMELLATTTTDSDEIGGLQYREMLRNRLARHCEIGTQRAQRLAVAGEESVEEHAPAFVSQCTENVSHRSN